MCQKCKQAGDSLETSRKYETPVHKEFELDYINKAKYLHTKCKDQGCVCQHKTNKKLISN